MIPYQLDPTLHSAPPAPADLGDGFAPPPDLAAAAGKGAAEAVPPPGTRGLEQPPSAF